MLPHLSWRIWFLAITSLALAGCMGGPLSNLKEVAPSVPAGITSNVALVVIEGRPYAGISTFGPALSGVINTFGMKAAVLTTTRSGMDSMLASMIQEGFRQAGTPCQVVLADDFINRFVAADPNIPANRETARQYVVTTTRLAANEVSDLSRLASPEGTPATAWLVLFLNDWRWEFRSYKDPNFFTSYDVNALVVSSEGRQLSHRAFRGVVSNHLPNTLNPAKVQLTEFKSILEQILGDPGLRGALEGKVDPQTYLSLTHDEQRAQFLAMSQVGLLPLPMVDLLMTGR